MPGSETLAFIIFSHLFTLFYVKQGQTGAKQFAKLVLSVHEVLTHFLEINI